ncbi:MAG: hypothetical protein IJX86_07980 [Lachnospiraceae bacterium]|nr:hypothetical protein [Lachnospiraceae bacterium]
MTRVEELIDWLLKCDYVQVEGGSGTNFEIPQYEIMPKDFLKYAEQDLCEESAKGKIGVVANLKRAVDSQLDLFYETLNLKSIFSKNNLKFEKKTGFLADVGMFQSKSINKLNTMRNKLEHEYTLPTEADLDIYYEMVWNVIEIISLNMQLLSMSEVYFVVLTSSGEAELTSKYDIGKGAVVFEVCDENKQEYIIEVSLKEKNDYDIFVKAFKLFRYMMEYNYLMNYEHLRLKLEEIY